MHSTYVVWIHNGQTEKVTKRKKADGFDMSWYPTVVGSIVGIHLCNAVLLPSVVGIPHHCGRGIVSICHSHENDVHDGHAIVGNRSAFHQIVNEY